MNPLDQLKDLHLPQPPGLWPLAPGWWILLALFTGAALIGAVLALRRHRRNRYRREALVLLADLSQQEPLDILAVLTLIRRTALSADGQAHLATIPSGELLEHLDQFAGGRISASFTAREPSLGQLATALYSSGPTALSSAQQEALLQAARLWIRKHPGGKSC